MPAPFSAAATALFGSNTQPLGGGPASESEEDRRKRLEAMQQAQQRSLAISPAARGLFGGAY